MVTQHGRRTGIALLVVAVLLASSTRGLPKLGVNAYDDTSVSWIAKASGYNPSLVEYGGQLVSALKHTVIKRIRSKMFWINKLYICVGATSNLQALQCESYDPWTEPYPECEFKKNVGDGRTDVTGLGDMKIWTWPGKGVYAIFGRKPPRLPNGSNYCEDKVIYDQWISQVRSEPGDGLWHLQRPLRLQITSGYTHPESAPYVREKNWMPWVYRHKNGSETLYVTHSVNPHRVLEVSPSGACAVRHEIPGNSELFAKFANFSIHGGPPIVWIGPKLARDGLPYYMGIMHHIERKRRGIKRYRHFAFKFQVEPPFAVTDISDELELKFTKQPALKAFIAYVAGFYVSDSGTAYISYGSADRVARIMTMPLLELEAQFTGMIDFLPK